MLVTGLILTLLLALGSWRATSEERTAELSHQGALFSRLITQTIDLAITRVSSVEAFFEASEEITEVEFGRFALHQGKSTGMVAIGFATVVAPDDFDTFVEEGVAVRSHYVTLDGDRRPITDPPTDRNLVPVWFGFQFQVMPGILGLDLGADPTRRAAILKATGTDETVVSDVVDVLGRPEDRFVEIYAPVGSRPVGRPGVAFATVNIDDLIASGRTTLVDVAGVSITDVPFREESQTVATGSYWSDVVPVGDRLWLVELERTSLSSVWAVPGIVLATGLIVTLLAVGLASMAGSSRVRRDELTKILRITRDKDLFLASVAHELRTPLTSVVGATALLAERWEDMDRPVVDELLTVAHAESTDLADLIDDLLVAGRLDSGTIHFRLTAVDLSQELTRVLDRLSNHDLVIEMDLPGDMTHASADPLRVRQIMRNLAVNAVRYADRRLDVTLKAEGSEVHLVMANDGPPISADLTEVLFRPYQGGHDRDTQPGSIGLGLPVSRRLAEAMGGSLDYEYLDERCTFTLVLPAYTPGEARVDRSALAPQRSTQTRSSQPVS